MADRPNDPSTAAPTPQSLPPPLAMQPAGPRRPAPAARLPSCQIYSTNDSSSSNRSSGLSGTLHRARAATISSPDRDRYSRSSNNNAHGLSPVTEGDPAASTRMRTTMSNRTADGVAAHAAPSTATDGGNNITADPPSSSWSAWAGALVGKGGGSRKRAATTSVAADRGQMSRTHSIDIGSTVNDQLNGTARRERDSAMLAGGVAGNAGGGGGSGEAYGEQVHDLLDVLDPEVQTVNLLGDFQNAFFIPPNRLFDRTRKVQLTKPPESQAQPIRPFARRSSHQELGRVDENAPAGASQQAGEVDLEKGKEKPPPVPSAVDGDGDGKPLPTVPAATTGALSGTAEAGAEARAEGEGGSGTETPVDVEEATLLKQSVLKGQYFVLPKSLVDMSDWSDQEKADLDDYVRHLMHSKKENFRRKWRGFKKYVRTPLGCFVTVYASLLTFWGAAWVLFLIGWLPAGDRRKYFVEICDQILVALFCVTGLGLIPWRIRDSYHSFYIIKYHNKTLKLRKKRGLPKLADDNDLPNDQRLNHDLEMAGHAQDAVLNDTEQTLLVKHQTALAKSHTYYRPHETMTHHAFPLKYLIAIIVLCDCHSCFQLALGSATWSISYHHYYKKILTTIILCFSLSCNISGGILIAIGSRLSRKTEVVEALMRQHITEEAIRRKEDAERYLAEKRQRKASQREKENGQDILRTGSYPVNATKAASSAAAVKLKQMATRHNSDPGIAEKLLGRPRSSRHTSMDEPRAEKESAFLKRSASGKATPGRHSLDAWQ